MTKPNDPFTVVPFEFPEQVRAFAEKGLSQARDNYARFKDAAEAQNDAMEEMFTVASRGASEYAAKVMEFLKVNTNSAFDFAQDLLTVRSPTETLESQLEREARQVAELSQTQDSRDAMHDFVDKRKPSFHGR